MRHALEEPEYPIVFIPKFREVGMSIRDGEDSILLFACCPWCGSALPKGLHSEWFDELERRNIDPYGMDVPPEFLSADWYCTKAER
jgi:hypothetical protein